MGLYSIGHGRHVHTQMCTPDLIVLNMRKLFTHIHTKMCTGNTTAPLPSSPHSKVQSGQSSGPGGCFVGELVQPVEVNVGGGQQLPCIRVVLQAQRNTEHLYLPLHHQLTHVPADPTHSPWRPYPPPCRPHPLYPSLPLMYVTPPHSTRCLLAPPTSLSTPLFRRLCFLAVMTK